MKALVGAFNQEKALVGAFSVIVNTGCGTDGALHSTSYKTQAASPPGHRSTIAGALLQYPDIIYWQGTEKFCMLATLAHLPTPFCEVYITAQGGN